MSNKIYKTWEWGSQRQDWGKEESKGLTPAGKLIRKVDLTLGLLKDSFKKMSSKAFWALKDTEQSMLKYSKNPKQFLQWSNKKYTLMFYDEYLTTYRSVFFKGQLLSNLPKTCLHTVANLTDTSTFFRGKELIKWFNSKAEHYNYCWKGEKIWFIQILISY